MAKEMSADQIENQLLILRKAISKFPSEESLTRDQKNRYYPLKGKIAKLETQLIARREYEYLAR